MKRFGLVLALLVLVSEYTNDFSNEGFAFQGSVNNFGYTEIGTVATGSLYVHFIMYNYTVEGQDID